MYAFFNYSFDSSRRHLTKRRWINKNQSFDKNYNDIDNRIQTMLSIFWLPRNIYFAVMCMNRIENELWYLRKGFSLLSKMLILHELCLRIEDSRRNNNPNRIATCSLENFVVNMSTYPTRSTLYRGERTAWPDATLRPLLDSRNAI